MAISAEVSGTGRLRRGIPPWHDGEVSEEQKKPENRARPTTDEFRAFVAEDWAPRSPAAVELSEAARYAAARASRRQRGLRG